MKGFTHFMSGVAVASFGPWAIDAALQGNPIYFILGGACGIAGYHYTLIRNRERAPCFAAFRHNNWLGAAVFAGVALDYALR